MDASARSNRILGVDPGSTATGWGVVESVAGRVRLLECGLIRLARGRPFAARLDALHGGIVELTERFSPRIACVEAPFHGINARSALQLAHARGVVLAALAGSGVDVEEVAPATVKRIVAGNGRADKSQVAVMIGTILGVDDPWESTDVSDAVAVAYCGAARQDGRDGLERCGLAASGALPRGRGRGRARGPVVRRAR